MSSAPASPASSAAVALAEARRGRHAVRGGAGGRRAVPLLFRPRAGLPHRQRQPPAALRQHRRSDLSAAASAPQRPWSARPSRAFRSSSCRAASGGRWRRATGRIPWWIFARSRRVPGTRARDYLRLLALRRAGAEASVAAVLDDGGPLYRRLLEPLAVAALNTAPEEGLARLLARGGAGDADARRRRLPADVSARRPVRNLRRSRARLACAARRARCSPGGASARSSSRVIASPDSLDADGTHAVAGDEAVVLAVPPYIAADLLPGLTAPDAFEPDPQHPFPRRADAARRLHRRDRRHRAMGFRQVRAWFPSPSAPPTTWSISRPRRSPRASGPMCARPSTLRRADAAGARGEGAARDVRRHCRAGAAPARGAHGARLTWCWPGTGRQPGLPATIEGAIRSGRAAANLLTGAS